MDKIKFKKVRDVKSPNRGTAQSAGIDLFIPNDFEPLQLQPSEHVLIPAGLKFNFEKNAALIAFNKSGIATKKQLAVGACVCDSDYQGELHISLFNVGQQSVVLKPGDKIVQFVLVPVLLHDLEEVEDLYDDGIETERGAGGFGSTGDK